jgi:pSer/pThr/pTyr-binding forkhead associated (FHA) protein
MNVDKTIERSAGHRLTVSGGRLVVETGPSAGRDVALDREALVIGRAPGNGLVLDDPAVSATHCELVATEGGPVLRDLDSTNGVMLAGHRVSELVLHDGSTFTVGSSRLRFSSHGERVELAVSEMEQFGGLFGRSRAMRQVFGKLERVAALELTLLVTGETGTGKEVLARSVHQMSLRAERPFVVLDCGSIPRGLGRERDLWA